MKEIDPNWRYYSTSQRVRQMLKYLAFQLEYFIAFILIMLLTFTLVGFILYWLGLDVIAIAKQIWEVKLWIIAFLILGSLAVFLEKFWHYVP